MRHLNFSPFFFFNLEFLNSKKRQIATCNSYNEDPINFAKTLLIRYFNYIILKLYFFITPISFSTNSLK